MTTLELIGGIYASKPRLDLIKKKKLVEILKNAGRNVPYYAKIFNEQEINPDEITSINVIDIYKKLPCLTKDILRNKKASKFISGKYKFSSLESEYTSGSTGKKIYVYLTKEEKNKKDMVKLRSMILSGYNPFRKRIDLNTYFHIQRNKLNRFGILRSMRIKANTQVEKIIERAHAFKANSVIGFPHLLRQIAEKSENLRFKLVMTIGEVLDSETRKFLENKFSCVVRDQYGAVEVGRIAFECKYCGMKHINEDNLWIDVNEKNEIIITQLIINSMPIIKYNVGDVVEIQESKCKIPFRNIKSIEGRKDDYILLKNKTKLSPVFLLYLFYGNDSISEFQLVQEKIDCFKVYVVADNRFSKKIFRTDLNKYLDGKIDIFCVKNIKKTKRGKLKAIISKVKNDN